MRSSGVESWLSSWPAMWSLLRGVDQCPLLRLAREWWHRAKSIVGSRAESWPLLWPLEVEQSRGRYGGRRKWSRPVGQIGRAHV